jgi:hypothetical protein
MKRILVLVAFGLLGVASLHGANAGKGKGKQVRFVGEHPIPNKHGGGVCHIEVPHVHAYLPTDAKVQYRLVDDHYYFVGDPVAYGWDGPRHAYKGHHPIPIGTVVYDHRDHDDVEYCYLDGAHYHTYAPPAELSFELKGDAYWYVGDFPKAYASARVEYDPIDVVYEPIVYTRPVVVVEPPSAWVGLRIGGPAVIVDSHGHGHGHVHGHGHGHVDAHVGIGVAVEVPTIVVGGGVYVDGHHHHDNGWHKGHYKKKHKYKGKRRGHRRGKWKW